MKKEYFKSRSQEKKEAVTAQVADKIADKLADKPYGKQKRKDRDEKVRTSINLPRHILEAVEDMATKNKRYDRSFKSVSSVFAEAVRLYILKEKDIGR